MPERNENLRRTLGTLSVAVTINGVRIPVADSPGTLKNKNISSKNTIIFSSSIIYYALKKKIIVYDKKFHLFLLYLCAYYDFIVTFTDRIRSTNSRGTNHPEHVHSVAFRQLIVLFMFDCIVYVCMIIFFRFVLSGSFFFTKSTKRTNVLPQNFSLKKCCIIN